MARGSRRYWLLHQACRPAHPLSHMRIGSRQNGSKIWPFLTTFSLWHKQRPIFISSLQRLLLSIMGVIFWGNPREKIATCSHFLASLPPLVVERLESSKIWLPKTPFSTLISLRLFILFVCFFVYRCSLLMIVSDLGVLVISWSIEKEQLPIYICSVLMILSDHGVLVISWSVENGQIAIHIWSLLMILSCYSVLVVSQ